MSTALPDKLREELDTPFTPTPAQVSAYRENGFVRIKDLLSPALLAHYQPAIEAEVHTAGSAPLDEQLARDREDDTYARAFQQVINLWLHSPAVREFVFGRRLASTAAALMGVEGVRLYHDQALFKAPGGGHTPYHCDQFYWPLDGDKTVTAWVPLVPVPQDMGPMEFVPGSQRADLGRHVPIGVESDRVVGEAVQSGGYRLARGGFDLGEVSFHAGWTFHRTGPNSSPHTRKVMTVIFVDQDIRMAAPANDNQRADAVRYLQGVSPGEVCAGPRNPLLWSRTDTDAGREAGAVKVWKETLQGRKLPHGVLLAF